jgi:hypothetical protein
MPPHTRAAWPGAGPRQPCMRTDCPLSFFSLDVWKLPSKIRLQELVASNAENISCVSLLIHKNSRKQGTGTMATR